MIILRRISSMESVSYTLKLGLTKVGRDISSNIHLNNSFVSRHHALIDVEENGTASVTDLGSSNGTYINSAVLNPKDFFTIEDGDILSFGVDTFTDDRTGCVFKVVIIEDGSNDDQQSNLQNGTQEPEKPSEKKDIVKECSVVLERLRLSNIDGHENNGSNVNGLENDDEKNNRMDEDPLLEDEPAIRKRRLSQDSIENLRSKRIRSKDDDKMDYTMDDIVICDDNEEDSEQFPCSQIFDDVQDKIVSDSDNDGDSEREDVIEIDDDSDEFGENERQWFNRLSQTFGSPGVMVKEEPIVLISDDDDDDNDDDCGDGVKEPQDGCCDAEKESASKAADEVSAVKCVLDSEQRITDGDIYIDLKNVPLPEEIIDNEIVSSDCEKIQVLKESSDNEIARSSGNFQMSKESIDEEKDSNGENVENVLDDFKPKTKAASKKIKLVEAMPISRRTRSKKRKNRSKPTKVNVSPLKPTLTNSQKTLRKEKLKTIATVDNNSTAAAAANDNEINPTHSRSTSCAKVTPKSRSDILVDSLINNKPSTSSNKGFRIPKVKKSNRDKCPTDELNHDTSPTENVSDEIAIAGPSSAVPKRKNVSFNDNIQCMEIEPIAGTRKYQFSKLDHKTIRRADQALPMQINTYKMSWKLDEIFSYILRWSVTWLEEEKKFSAQGVLRKPPPVGFEIPIKRLPFEFQNYFEYYKCVLPLALLEMWAKTSNDYFNKANQMYLVKVDSYRKENLEISMLPNSTACRKQLVINCHTFIHDRNMREGYLRTGDFGIAELRFSINGQNKHVYINVFCYVQNVSARRLGSAPYIGDTDLLQKLGLEYDSNLHCLDLVLLIKWRSEEEALVTNGIVRLKIISYIRPTLKHFVSLLNLQASPLSAAILSPSTFDFSVEELQIRKPHGKLNHAQERAVAQATKLCLSAKPNIGLIHGPPGTGKSHVIISLIQHIISECTRLFKTRPRILLCAPTNAAIDQLAIKLRDIRSKLPEKKRFKLIRTGQVDRKSEVYCLTPESLAETQLKKAANKDSEEHELELRILQAQRTGYASAKSDSKIDKNRTDFLQKKIDAIDASLKTLLINGDQPRALRYQLRETEISVIKHAEIIATTLSSCTNDQFVNALTDNGRENPSITCCIIDEAAQCNETEILLPLVLDVKKMILVGDPLQLTATTFSEVSRQMGYGNSLFSRINEVWKNNKNCASASPIHFLDTQYRMHSSIASWPSRFVYQGRLKNNDLLQKDSELNAYMLINHSFPQSRERETNRMEAELVVSMAFSILKKSSSEALRIGVITPYSNQRKLIQTLIANRSNIECDFGNRLEVNSIDGFQGQERDVIIVSLVRSEGIGFMSDVQRINVMLTRAERCLLVCANFKAFLTNNIWKELYEDGCRRRKIFAINELDEEQLNELMETIYAKQKRTVSKVRSRHQ